MSSTEIDVDFDTNNSSLIVVGKATNVIIDDTTVELQLEALSMAKRGHELHTLHTLNPSRKDVSTNSATS